MSGLECTNKTTEDEDATELRLGTDFQGAQALTMNEVMLISESKKDDDQEQFGVETITTQTRVFEKTLAYTKRFGGATSSQQATVYRDLCTNANLHAFETATVINTMPQNYDEATTLVPSLLAKGPDGHPRFTKEQIEALLEDLNNVRAFE
jgi:DNA-directed RNA polymerase II subunit RPB4|tara:strand:+ start:156 stop:608 length:453 start_codon:yes stop_codon:yes gene_type:complete